jgi:hypothetical protein
MNLRTTLAAAALITLTSFAHAESKRVAEFLLSDPNAYEGKEVTLDVSFVQPVRWVSPFPEIAFFQAMTIDRTDKKGGGGILVAVPAEASAKFAKKYGTDFDGRYDKDTLRGVFIAAGGGRHRKIWMVDTTGKLLELMATRKKDLPEGAQGDDSLGGAKGSKGKGHGHGGPRGKGLK